MTERTFKVGREEKPMEKMIQEIIDVARPHGTHEAVKERLIEMAPFMNRLSSGTWELADMDMGITESLVALLRTACRYDKWRIECVHQVSLVEPTERSVWLTQEAYRRVMKESLRLSYLSGLNDSVDCDCTWHKVLRCRVGTELYNRLGTEDVRKLQRILNDEDIGITGSIKVGTYALLGIDLNPEYGHLVNPLQRMIRKSLIMTHLYEIGFCVIGDFQRADEVKSAREFYERALPLGVMCECDPNNENDSHDSCSTRLRICEDDASEKMTWLVLVGKRNGYLPGRVVERNR
ncbi:hypothetical protein ACFL26_01605 [Patescibacteria group bacterium]